MKHLRIRKFRPCRFRLCTCPLHYRHPSGLVSKTSSSSSTSIIYSFRSQSMYVWLVKINMSHGSTRSQSYKLEPTPYSKAMPSDKDHQPKPKASKHFFQSLKGSDNILGEKQHEGDEIHGFQREKKAWDKSYSIGKTLNEQKALVEFQTFGLSWAEQALR